MKILLAEDDIVTSVMIQRVLEKKDHSVTLVKDGKEAWDLIQANYYEIVILDLVLPNMDGLKITSNLRNLKNDNYTYVLLMSSKLGKEDRLLTFKIGIDNFVLKPLDEIELNVQIKLAEKFLTVKKDVKRYAKLAERNRLAANKAFQESNKFKSDIQESIIANIDKIKTSFLNKINNIAKIVPENNVSKLRPEIQSYYNLVDDVLIKLNVMINTHSETMQELESSASEQLAKAIEAKQKADAKLAELTVLVEEQSLREVV